MAAHNIKILIFTLVVLNSCSTISSNNSTYLMHQNLIGTWQSDKEKTLEYNLEISPKDNLVRFFGKYEHLYGKLIIEYKKDTYTINFINEENFYKWANYNIISTGKNSITIEAECVFKEPNFPCENEIDEIFFESKKSFYVKMWDITEYFKKID